MTEPQPEIVFTLWLFRVRVQPETFVSLPVAVSVYVEPSVDTYLYSNAFEDGAQLLNTVFATKALLVVSEAVG